MSLSRIYFRYEYVKNLIRKYNATSIIDLGCGDCSFMKEVTQINNINRLIGIDLHPTSLAKGIGTFNKSFDHQHNSKVRRKVNLEVEVRITVFFEFKKY